VSADLGRVEATAVEIARAAGAMALAAFRRGRALEFKGKHHDDPVTATDREVEQFLRCELARAFPDHGMLGEETETDVAPDARCVWALDPLDGTANFASGLPAWGVSMGLLCAGAPVVGCIFAPIGPDLQPGVFHARLGGGARFDDQPLRVSAAADERGQIMALPGAYWRAFRLRLPPRGTPRPKRNLPDGRSLGSCTAELGLVAAGALRATVFTSPRIWDVAAGGLIVEEAGGLALTWQERRWQRLAHYAPMPPPKGAGAPALRHWSQPVVAGAPDAVERLLPRLAWHPRPPRALLRVLGLAQEAAATARQRRLAKV
jgi:myo-inositol-1(or 4)-monophosphatase